MRYWCGTEIIVRRRYGVSQQTRSNGARDECDVVGHPLLLIKGNIMTMKLAPSHTQHTAQSGEENSQLNGI